MKRNNEFTPWEVVFSLCSSMIIPFPRIMLMSENTFKEGPILDSTQRMSRIGMNSKLFTKRNGEN